MCMGKISNKVFKLKQAPWCFAHIRVRNLSLCCEPIEILTGRMIFLGCIKVALKFTLMMIFWGIRVLDPIP